MARFRHGEAPRVCANTRKIRWSNWFAETFHQQLWTMKGASESFSLKERYGAIGGGPVADLLGGLMRLTMQCRSTSKCLLRGSNSRDLPRGASLMHQVSDGHSLKLYPGRSIPHCHSTHSGRVFSKHCKLRFDEFTALIVFGLLTPRLSDLTLSPDPPDSQPQTNPGGR